MDSPTLDIHLHKQNKVQNEESIRLRYNKCQYINTSFHPTRVFEPSSIVGTFPPSKTKTVWSTIQNIKITLKECRSKITALDMIKTKVLHRVAFYFQVQARRNDMNTANDMNTSTVQLELQARPLHNLPAPPSHGTTTANRGEMKINTQIIDGFSYTDLLGDADNTDSNENSFASPSSPTPNENGIWDQRPKLDLKVLTPKYMALLTVKAFGREDITDYLLEVHLLALFHALGLVLRRLSFVLRLEERVTFIFNSYMYVSVFHRCAMFYPKNDTVSLPVVYK
jgi:hypothetical protein